MPKTIKRQIKEPSNDCLYKIRIPDERMDIVKAVLDIMDDDGAKPMRNMTASRLHVKAKGFDSKCSACVNLKSPETSRRRRPDNCNKIRSSGIAKSNISKKSRLSNTLSETLSTNHVIKKHTSIETISESSAREACTSKEVGKCDTTPCGNNKHGDEELDPVTSKIEITSQGNPSKSDMNSRDPDSVRLYHLYIS